METDPRPAPEDCLKTRSLFPRALEDPSVEEEILLHARGCLECMDAFLELQDTVKKLKAAAFEIPDTSHFSIRVLKAIEEEGTHPPSPARRPLLVAAAGVLGGIALTLVLVLAVTANRAAPAPPAGFGGDAGLAPEPPAPPGPDAPAPPVARDPGEGAGHEPLPGPEEPPATTAEGSSDPVEALFQAILWVEREPLAGRPGRPGSKAFRMRPLMTQASLLDAEGRERLIQRLQDPAEAPMGLAARRFRDEILGRIKSLPDKGFRRPGERGH